MSKVMKWVSRVGGMATVAVCMVTTNTAMGAPTAPISVSIYSDAFRAEMSDAGYAALETLPTRKEIAQLGDKNAQVVLNRIVDLTERATQADSISDRGLEQLVGDLGFLTAAFQVRTGGSDESGTNVSADPFDCVGQLRTCYSQNCGSDRSWPCFCCAPCNVAYAACIAISIIKAM